MQLFTIKEMTVNYRNQHKPATCNFLPSCYKFDRATLQRLHELCKTFQNKPAGSFWEVLCLNLRVLRV